MCLATASTLCSIHTRTHTLIRIDLLLLRCILLARLLKLGRTCSMFGVWGSRTENGELFSGRNLDWAADTGVAEFKLITVREPVDTT